MSEINYYRNSIEDARETAREFIDEIVEQLAEDGKASDDLLNDYPDGDSYHHETHVDKWYDLLEAATLLHQLRDYEETDSGLWEGLEPVRAVCCQAAFTYGNAVMSQWFDLVERINEDEAVVSAVKSFQDSEDEDASTDAIEQAVMGVINAE